MPTTIDEPMTARPLAELSWRPGTELPPAPLQERRASNPRWRWPALIALLTVTAVAYLWDLSASGFANSFYAAAVEAGTKSWKAFFFGSLDSSSFITVDKPPASLWVMEITSRIFGFSSWSMLVPEALAGVASVGLLYATVKRWFGEATGLLAGAMLAVTPVAALMFRFNNPDALLVLCLVASAYTLVRGCEDGKTRWAVATGAFLGLAFLTKMLQAFTVLPAFFLAYFLLAPGSALRRAKQLAITTATIVASAGWWVAIVALWPAGARPYIDGSPDNSILNLIFGYNGFGRLLGSSGPGGSGGAGFSGAPGIFRLFNDLMGGQASWLIPAALLTLVAGLAWTARSPRRDRTRGALVLWGGWLLVTGGAFSLGKGIIHTYYTVALAPAIAALAAIGATLVWQHRQQFGARALGAFAIVATAGWSYALLDRTPSFDPWLRPTVLAAGLLAAAAVLYQPAISLGSRRILAAGAGLGLAASLAGPLAYTAVTISTAHTGSVPSAGPGTHGGGFGSGGGGFGSGGRPPGVGNRPSPLGKDGAPLGFGGSPSGGTPTAAPGPAGTGSFGTLATDKTLVHLLEGDAGHYRWVAATFGSQEAATLELATGGGPVMAIGGFDGEGGNITLAQFELYVSKGEIHYFIASGAAGLSGGPAGGAGVSNSDSAITAWVESHFTAATVDGTAVYNLASPK